MSMQGHSMGCADWHREQRNLIGNEPMEYKPRTNEELHDENLKLVGKVLALTARRDEFQSALYAANHSEQVAIEMFGHMTKQRDELLEALEYHQEQTRPIQRTIDIIARVKSDRLPDVGKTMEGGTALAKIKEAGK